jgi:peptidoglycan/xylan/chitin deacetylase (PgdA/CDA1 family)
MGLMACGINKSVPAQASPPQVILKLDDAWPEDQSVHAGWVEVFDYLNEQGVTGTIGVVGGRGDQPSPAYYTWLKAQAQNGHELWNHGWCHCKDEDGSPEFRGNDYAYQYDHLIKNQAVIQENVGITMCAFGAPYNAVDSVTATALAAVPELKIWMYPASGIKTDKAILPRISAVNIEYPVHKPDFEAFRTGYLAHQDEPVLVIQGHPRSWMVDGRLDEFKKIINFLRQRNTLFTTPTVYVDHLRHSSPK